MAFPKKVTLIEVSPRDGLQNEAAILPTEIKIAFINQLSETGLSVIESASFVSPKWVPQLADGSEVMRGIRKQAGVRYPVLIPNVTGLEHALAADAKEIAVFTTASETFSKKNTNCSVAESLKRIADVLLLAKKEGLRVRGYVSCVLGCPYEGNVLAEKTAQVATQLLDLGCDEIALGDTLGVGTPFKVLHLMELILKTIPVVKIGVHFHDTYGQALANLYAALSLGVAIIDSSVSGLGCCPYAKGASGNVATEEVVYMLDGMGIETGVDLKKLVAAGRFISEQLHRQSQSKVNRALSQL